MCISTEEEDENGEWVEDRQKERPAECGRMSVHVMKCDSGMGEKGLSGGGSLDVVAGWLAEMEMGHEKQPLVELLVGCRRRR